MTPEPAIDWLWPVVVLVVGALAGLFFVWLARRRGGELTAAQEAPVELRDLAGQRDALLQQLRELDDTASKRTAEQLARERYRLELEAARAWRALDGLEAERSPAPSGDEAQTAAAGAANPALRGFLWGVGSVAAIGLLMFLVTRSAKPREEGGTVTGDIPAPARPETSMDPREAQIRAALEQDPDDVDQRIALAAVLLGRSDMMGVWNETQHVLQRHPGHPRALAYQALVRMAMGQADLALEMLRKAMADAPEVIDIHIHLALVYRRLGRYDEAEQVMTGALERFPEQQATLSHLFDELRRRVVAEAPAAAAGAENPHDVAPAPTRPAQPAPVAADSEAGVAGVIELDPTLAGQIPAGAVLFLIAREPGMDRGPPIAVRRLVADRFPMRFELSARDSMAGEALFGNLRIEARIDTDGNAMTRDAGAPQAVAEKVKTGTTDLRLVLRR